MLQRLLNFGHRLVLMFQIGYLEAELRRNGVDPYGDDSIPGYKP